MTTKVLIPAPGYRGDKFRAVEYEPRYGRSWQAISGENLWPGKEITARALADMLRIGAWRDESWWHASQPRASCRRWRKGDQS